MALRELLLAEPRRHRRADDATHRALQRFVMPIRLGTCLADRGCHRRIDTEYAAGVQESGFTLR